MKSCGVSVGAQSHKPSPHKPASLSLDAKSDRKVRKRRGGAKQGKPQNKPLAIEQRFTALVDGLVAPLIAETKRELTALRGSELSDKAVADILAKLEQKLQRLLPKEKLATLSAALVAEVSAWNAKQIARQVAVSDVSIKVPELTAATAKRLARDTIASIRGVPEQIVGRAAPLLTDATMRGLRAGEFAKELGNRLGLSQAKARDVATGAVLRTNASLTKERHAKLGITEYTWRASRDGFTRRWHRALDGQRFKYTDPPMGGGGGPKDRGNPGSADKCRCQAIPWIP